MYEDSLTSQTEILSWLDLASTAEFNKEYFDEYYKRRTKAGVSIKGIVSDEPLAYEVDKLSDEQKREMKIIPKEMMEIVPECYIYDDKIAFMSLKEKFGVMIESKDIAEAQRALYRLAWQAATEIVRSKKTSS